MVKNSAERKSLGDGGFNAAECADLSRGGDAEQPMPAGRSPVSRRGAMPAQGSRATTVVERLVGAALKPLCGGSSTQQAAQTFPACDAAEGTSYLLARHEDPIAHSLLVTFAVVVDQEFTNRISQRGLAEKIIRSEHSSLSERLNRSKWRSNWGFARQKQRLDPVALQTRETGHH